MNSYLAEMYAADRHYRMIAVAAAARRASQVDRGQRRHRRRSA